MNECLLGGLCLGLKFGLVDDPIHRYLSLIYFICQCLSVYSANGGHGIPPTL